MASDLHLVLQTGRGIKCACGDLACLLVRCTKCHAVIGSCTGKKCGTTGAELRADHALRVSH